jgi:hypothetical protein
VAARTHRQGARGQRIIRLTDSLERRMDDMSKEEAIRRKAYELWEAAGNPEGRADEFWEEARANLGGDDVEPVSADQSDTGPAGEAMTKT